MNAQQLKNAILQEAIEGRLVKQDPNDEPASVLLQRIRKEKERLVKEGKLKKKDLEVKPISEDEKPFEIPESWEWVRVSYLCVRFSTGPFGTMVHKEDYVDSFGHPMVNPTNIKNGQISLEGIKLVSDDKYEDLKSYVLQTNDLVLARRGDLSKIAVVSKNEEGWLAGTGSFFMHFIGVLYLPYFVRLYSTTFCQSYLLAQSVGGTMNNLNQKLLADFVIPLPPLAEQYRIVAKIEELLPKVEEYGKAQEALDKLNAELPERLKKSILQEAISGRLVPQAPNDEPASVLLDRIRKEKAQLVKAGKLKKKDLEEKPISEDEIPFEIPESWEWVRISNVINVIMGQSPDGSDVYDAKEDGNSYEFHQGKICFTEKYIASSGKWCKNPSRIANIGNLLICVRAPIGDVNITQRQIGIGRGLAAMEGQGGIKTLFLYYWMLAHKRCLVDQGTGSTFKAITVEVLKNQPIPLPPLAEQHRIVAKLEQLLGEIDKLKV